MPGTSAYFGPGMYRKLMNGALTAMLIFTECVPRVPGQGKTTQGPGIMMPCQVQSQSAKHGTCKHQGYIVLSLGRSILAREHHCVSDMQNIECQNVKIHLPKVLLPSLPRNSLAGRNQHAIFLLPCNTQPPLPSGLGQMEPNPTDRHLITIHRTFPSPVPPPTTTSTPSTKTHTAHSPPGP